MLWSLSCEWRKNQLKTGATGDTRTGQNEDFSRQKRNRGIKICAEGCALVPPSPRHLLILFFVLLVKCLYILFEFNVELNGGRTLWLGIQGQFTRFLGIIVVWWDFSPESCISAMFTYVRRPFLVSINRYAKKQIKKPKPKALEKLAFLINYSYFH